MKKKKNNRFERNWSTSITMYIFSLIHSSWIRKPSSRSEKIISLPRKSQNWDMLITTNNQIWGKNWEELSRVHGFGNGHEHFDAFKIQSCVIWWQWWYIWTRKYLRTCVLVYVLVYARATIFETSFIFLCHFRYDGFRFFHKLLN